MDGDTLTHGKQPPHDRGRGKAGEDVVCAGEVCEVWQHDGLSAALPPHVHLTALGLCCRGVCGVTGGDLHNPGAGRRRSPKAGSNGEGHRERIHAGGEGTKGKEHQSDSYTSLILPTLEITGLLIPLLCIFCKVILAEITAVTPQRGYERAVPHTTLKTG